MVEEDASLTRPRSGSAPQLAIKYQSRLLGFVASYLVFYLLGFAVIPLGMGYAVGWASEGALVTSHVARCG